MTGTRGEEPDGGRADGTYGAASASTAGVSGASAVHDSASGTSAVHDSASGASALTGTTGTTRTAEAVVGELGAVARQTPERVRDAAALVTRGRVFSLNWDLALPDPPILGRGRHTHTRIDLGNGFDDRLDSFYPQGSSQWDGLAHVRGPDGTYYGGHRAADIAAAAGPLGIEHWARRGIAGRFVLADLVGHGRHGGDCSRRVAYTAADVTAALAAQGTQPRPGDVLLLHFGWTRWYEGLDRAAREALAAEGFFASPGLAVDQETRRWLRGLELSAVAADCPAVEAMPFDMSGPETFLHHTLIAELGLAVGELFDLAALAEDCAQDGVHEGLFTAAPLHLTGAAGSTANALALK
ncbi:cyclase family protein [Streptomyces sp. NPDC087422]|uniref:cyclase family protein n=1 Tax=Streptomyces sp. NPDC087422 TaxID=3365786 RepID=UPI00380C90EB